MRPDNEFDKERQKMLSSLHGDEHEVVLRNIRDAKEESEEAHILAGYATPSSSSVGRMVKEEFKVDNRTAFSRDRDRITYSNAFYKLSGKTQVFINPNNPLVSTRMTHTIQVAQVSRVIARAIGLNEDLVEAIALGHDLGHSPFGHAGEDIIARKCEEAGIPSFKHNVHSLRVVDMLEKNGKGLNLTWEVREGILCHDGESDSEKMVPERKRKMMKLAGLSDKQMKKNPSTPEACLVRLCDRIAYAGKDIEDGIEAGLFSRSEIPGDYARILGNTNKMIMDTLVKDIILNFTKFLDKFQKENDRAPKSQEVVISLSPEIKNAVNGLIRDFNYVRIYKSKENLKYIRQTTKIVNALFDHFLDEIRTARKGGDMSKLTDFMEPDSIMDPHEKLYKSYVDAFLKSNIGEIEDFVKASTDHEAMEKTQGRMKHYKALNAVLASLDHPDMTIMKRAFKEARLRIIRDNGLTMEETLESIFYFLNAMPDDYIMNNSSGELARDYLASLADRTAINIFKRLNIPLSIV